MCSIHSPALRIFMDASRSNPHVPSRSLPSKETLDILSRDLSEFEFRGRDCFLVSEFHRITSDSNEHISLPPPIVEYHKRQIELDREDEFDELASYYNKYFEEVGLELTLAKFNSFASRVFEDRRPRFAIKDTGALLSFLESAQQQSPLLMEHDLKFLQILREHLLDTLLYQSDLDTADGPGVLNLLSKYREIANALTSLTAPLHTAEEDLTGAEYNRLSGLLEKRILREVIYLERLGVITRGLVHADGVRGREIPSPPASRWLFDYDRVESSVAVWAFKGMWDITYELYSDLLAARPDQKLLTLFTYGSSLKAIDESRKVLLSGTRDHYFYPAERKELIRFLGEQSAKFAAKNPLDDVD